MPDGGSTAGRKLLGEGREAEIFEWDDGTVLRLLRPGLDPARVQGEAAAIRAADAGGVDVPRVRHTVTVDGRAGLVMDRIDGPDLITLMGRRPWTIPRAARIVGTAQARMHEVAAPPDLDDLRSHARFKIEATADVPSDLAELALATLDSLPDGDRLCHGDMHPGNVLLGPRGPAVIDWTNATRGDPAGDVARTQVMLQLGAVQEYMPAVIRRLSAYGRSSFFRLYVRAYARARPIDAGVVERWEIVRAADRLFEGIEPERPALLELLERRAAELA